MNEREYLRQRLLIPIAIPLGAAALVAGITYLISRMLLAVDESTAPLVGLLIAIDILFAAALVATGRLRREVKAALVAGAVALLLAGGGWAIAVGERPIHEEAAGEPGAEAAPPAATGGGGPVDVGDNFFEPKEITIAAGETVVWEQTGVAPHTVTADDDSFDSHPDCGPANQAKCMEQDDTYSRTFDQPGRYPYYCKLHGGPGGAGMAGVVVVE